MPTQRNINLLILCRVSTKHVVGLFPWLYKVFIYSFSKPVHRPLRELAMQQQTSIIIRGAEYPRVFFWPLSSRSVRSVVASYSSPVRLTLLYKFIRFPVKLYELQRLVEEAVSSRYLFLPCNCKFGMTE